jgi:hypothetical protein
MKMGAVEDPVEGERPQAVQQSTLTNIRRIVSVAIAIWMLYVFKIPWSTYFQYHPFSMVIAFVAFLPEVLRSAFNVQRSLTMAHRQSAVDWHMNVALGMKLFALVGFIAITLEKNSKGKSHYYTAHGQLGLLTIVVVVLQVLLGLAYRYRWVGSQLSLARKIHRYLGAALMVLGCGSMYLGLMSHFAERAVQNVLIHTVFALAATGLALVAYFLE